MPIDDVDYLLENCVTDNHIIYIDSAKRDKAVFPQPSHYTIRFAHPYRFVHGIEVIDASIPSTMFNVDVHNNVLSYLSSPDGDMNSTLQELARIPGLREVLQFSLKDDIHQAIRDYGTTTPFKLALVDGDTQNLDDVFLNPLELRKFIDDCLHVDVNSLNIKDDSFDGLGSSTGISFDPSKTTYLVIKKHKMPNVKLYKSEQAAQNGSLPVYAMSVHDTTLYTTEAYLYDFYECFRKKYGNLSFYETIKKKQPKVTRTYTLQNKYCESDIYEWTYYTISSITEAEYQALPSTKYARISSSQTIFRPGNYSAREFLKLSEMFMTGDVSFNTGDVTTIETYPNFTLYGETPFVVNQLGSSIGSIIGLSEDASAKLPLNYTYIPNIPYFFGSIAENQDNLLMCPGMINFTANRYVILRCDELEDHMYGSYAYGDFTPGIAMLRFFEIEGVSHQRNDYVNFTKPPFHPIGKLDKITLTFLLPDLLTLYDFKGIDHLLLLSIKFYAPRQMRKMQSSVLNPNYNPDFHEYAHQHIDYKREIDVFDQKKSIEDDVEEANQVMEIEKRFDYFSDNDDDLDSEAPMSDFET